MLIQVITGRGVRFNIFVARESAGNSRPVVMDSSFVDPEKGRLTDESQLRTSCRTQADALFRKNLTYQKRNWKTNCCLIIFPVALCITLVVMQAVINTSIRDRFKCGCKDVPNSNGVGTTRKCGIQYSAPDEAPFCGIDKPHPWPAMLQVPRPQFRATKSSYYPDLTQDVNCRAAGTCAVTIPYTGTNKTTADAMAEGLLGTGTVDPFDQKTYSLSAVVPGTDATPVGSLLFESAFTYPTPIYILRSNCENSTDNFSFTTTTQGFKINRGYVRGNKRKEINEVPVAYDFRNTTTERFDVMVWYNETLANRTGFRPSSLIRVSRSVNMVVLTAIVYEKQYNVRMMMKMHGLGDTAYWVITYLYYVVLFCLYMISFIVFSSLVKLSFVTKNSYSLQAVFYFLYINMIISLGFVASNFFRNVRTATAFGYLYVFGAGLLGAFIFKNFIVNPATDRKIVTGLQLIPAFATYRGVYEFVEYSILAIHMVSPEPAISEDYLLASKFQLLTHCCFEANSKGMQWSNLKDENNGLRTVMLILLIQWFVFMLLNFYLDGVVASASGISKHPLFFLNFRRKGNKNKLAISSSSNLTSFRKFSRNFSGSSSAVVHMSSEDKLVSERPDVARENELAKDLAANPCKKYPIVCDNLQRVYPARDGNPPKYAVRGFSLAVPRGECFGILGPNGAGKTSSINMMIGFLKPTDGTAYIHGMDIVTDMDRIYSCMGVCPQHDLLWGYLTGREHLLFYGRLKNLKGRELTDAVEKSLKSVNLFDKGVGDKQCRMYSGGMKRRLSVAISLIGNPKVVYMDEPSTGLDPESRNNLWNVVKQSKQDRAIILTTHSMEEAEALCDRLGIFVNGELQCIGNAKELTARYGCLYVLTITTPPEEEAEVVALAKSLSPNAHQIYGISGTQKFELPKTDVRIASVFSAIEKAKNRLHIRAWGLADITLEDVFIKVARQSGGMQLQ
uniref:ABC transporter domain-containing protein n=1 Tax=Physcomitrium patens TaxID=3218 RepID=A0A7I4CAU7_PHYPA